MTSPSGSRARLAVLVLTVGFVLAGTSAASAAFVHPFAASFGSFANPQALAVDQGTGDVYVIDVGAANVQKFDASGNPVDFSAVGSNTLNGATGADATPEGGFSFDLNSAAELAVDNSGGPADGYLYVANSLAGVIDVFDATGTFVGEIDGSAATPQSGGETCGVAADPSGHVYSASFNGHVDKYTPTDGVPAHDTFAGQLENVGGVCNVAADGLGGIYVSTWPTGPLTKYDQSQLDQGTPSGTVVDGTSLAVAVDPTNNDVYVNHGNGIAQYDSSGTLIGQSGAGHLTGDSFGVAIRGSSGLLYASNSDDGTVQQYGAAIDVPAPVVTIDQPSNVTVTHATFTGTVNPSGTDPLNDTSWHFEYSTDGGSSFTSTPGGHIGTGTSPVAVSDDVSSFIPDQAVKVRLVATSGAAVTTSSTVSFTTTAIVPVATTQQAHDVAPTRATLTGLVDPNNAHTTYFFEYGPTTAYGTSVPATQDADAGSANETVSVAQRVAGLTPGSTYHFRLVAVNEAGTTPGADQTFTTTVAQPASPARTGIPGSGFLPDGRGWEKVSPGDKNGGDVMGVSTRTRVATDGSAVNFSSLAAFGDAIGTSIATDYMSIRTADGWATHAITPPQRSLPIGINVHGVQSLYDGVFSPDLSTGMFSAWSPLTNDPNVAAVPNLYVRRDLRTPGMGSYTLLSPCPLCDATSTPLPAPVGNGGGAGRPNVAGASADFGHVIFESQEPRTAEAPTGCNNHFFDAGQCPYNLYEWDHGTVRFVAFLPDDECSGAPPCTARFSEAGQGAANPVYTPHTISADGSRIFFTVTDGPFTQTGNLYMRVDHTTTVRLNASERTTCADHNPCDGTPEPDASAPAAYWDATADGSRIFFTTKQALTDDASAGGIAKLYMYDASKPDSDSHNLTLLSHADVPSAAGGVQSVVGVGGDGHYVYFLATGEFVAGQPAVDRAIYVWHDGTVRFIAPVASDDDGDDTTVTNWSLSPSVSRVTPDGRHLLFSSRAPGIGPTGYDQTCDASGGRCRQLYVYDYGSQQVACVSCNPTGARAAGDAFATVDANRGDASFTFLQNASLSDDGRRVFFDSPDPLVPEDRNGKFDAYEYDVATGTDHLISSGRDPSGSFFLDASPSGDDVFLVTREQLTSSDIDNNYDLYDARVGGGFPEPPPPAPACTGEGCQPPPTGAPGATAPGTGVTTGDGNLPAKPKAKPKRKPCRKGFVRKKVHGRTTCVKVKRKPRRLVKHATKARRAKATPRRPK